MEMSVRNLMFDLASGRELYDADENRVISKAEANDAIRKVCFEILGLNEKSTTRDINRALKRDSAHELFQVIEEILDNRISTGWHESEFFNQFVETKNMADGDENEFWMDKDVILTVSKVSGDHHDLTMQKLAEGESQSIPTIPYAIKVGSDIRLFLTGRKDWNQFIDAVAVAFQKQIMDDMFSEFVGTASALPPSGQFTKTGSIVKATLDTLIEDVSMANDNAPVVIMGVKTALKKLNGVYATGNGVDWIAESQKESVANSGIIGNYEGTALMEIPNRFEKNDTTKKLVPANILFIMPLVETKPVKFVDYGETSLEVTEIGGTRDDLQSYEVQRRMGVGTIITNYFGIYSGI